MQEYKRIRCNDDYWVIIKLDDDEKEVLGKSFAVSQGYVKDGSAPLCERIAFLNGTDKLVGLQEDEYEGLFDTELECYYFIKCRELYEQLEIIQISASLNPQNPRKLSEIIEKQIQQANTVDWFFHNTKS